MATSAGTKLRKQLRGLVAAQCPGQHSDMYLLQQFISERDEAAFAALVKRHGAMVLGVCRSVLKHQHDAEDAFQAAFLVLANQAATIRKQDSLGSWLHGVAYRLAVKAGAKAGRRRESPLPVDDPVAASSDDLTLRELRGIVHEELDRLGDKFRAPLLLCYWEGKTRDEAAEQLGMTADTFKKRLERARHLLGNRLARRGLALSTAGIATLLSSSGVQAALPGVLVTTTTQAAVAISAGKTTGVSATVLALIHGAIQPMKLTLWTTALLSILLLGGLGAGIASLPFASGGAAQGTPQTNGAKQPGKAGAAKSDVQRIVGVWRIKNGVADGNDLPDLQARLMRIEFSKDGGMAVSLVQDVKPGKYALVEAGKIDLLDAKKADKVFGIFQFDGDDRFTLCIKEAGDKARPTEFTGAKGTGQVLMVLDRCKPGEEKPTKEDVAKAGDFGQAGARAISANNLKQIGLAFHNYEATYTFFPAHAIYSKDGKTPLLSWRVAILPYIEEAELYKKFKLDEAWDSPHNKKLIPLMPKLYAGVGASKAKEGETHYQIFTGPDTAFEGAKGIAIRNIADGTSNTILALEAKDAVIWTKPADLTLPNDKTKLPAVGELFEKGFNVLFFDGSVRFVARTVEPAVIRVHVTPKAGD
jgi:RNA polymerase sigma factor (sigma-70 family)